MNVAKAFSTLNLSFEQHSAETIKRAYRTQQMRWHPDRHVGSDSIKIANGMSAKINQAYEVLSEISDSSSWSKHAPSNSYQPRHHYDQSYFTPGFPDSCVLEIFVKSSNIVSAGYRMHDNTMFIKFRGDSVYLYFDVPQSVFDEFLQAPSQGKFAHARIYPNFRYQKSNKPNVPYNCGNIGNH